MNYKLLSIALLVSFNLFGQSKKSAREEILKAVDTQVWIPFISALQENDVDGYGKVHSKNVLRVSNDLGGKFWSGESYFAYIEKNFERMTEKGVNQKIEISFSERMASEKVVSDRGYYKYSYWTDRDTPKFIYGKFHLLFAQEDDGAWRILMDYDLTDQEGIYKVGAEEFEKAQPLEM